MERSGEGRTALKRQIEVSSVVVHRIVDGRYDWEDGRLQRSERVQNVNTNAEPSGMRRRLRSSGQAEVFDDGG